MLISSFELAKSVRLQFIPRLKEINLQNLNSVFLRHNFKLLFLRKSTQNTRESKYCNLLFDNDVILPYEVKRTLKICERITPSSRVLSGIRSVWVKDAKRLSFLLLFLSFFFSSLRLNEIMFYIICYSEFGIRNFQFHISNFKFQIPNSKFLLF